MTVVVGRIAIGSSGESWVRVWYTGVGGRVLRWEVVVSFPICGVSFGGGPAELQIVRALTVGVGGCCYESVRHERR